MGTEITEVSEISSYSGKCHVEMTREQAKEQGRSIFREFKRLDTDKDGELSFEEIMNPRDKATKKKRFSAGAYTVAGALLAFDGFRSTLPHNEAIILEKIKIKNGGVLDPKIANISLKFALKFQLLLTLGVAAIAIVKKIKSDRMAQENEALKSEFTRLQTT